MWSPWDHLAMYHPGMQIEYRTMPRPTIRGALISHRRIALADTLDTAARRCTIAHEAMHLLRGPRRNDPDEERAVNALAARLLIQLDDLAWAINTTTTITALCRRLVVTRDTLATRLRKLTPDELLYLAAAVVCPERLAWIIASLQQQ